MPLSPTIAVTSCSSRWRHIEPTATAIPSKPCLTLPAPRAGELPWPWRYLLFSARPLPRCGRDQAEPPLQFQRRRGQPLGGNRQELDELVAEGTSTDPHHHLGALNCATPDFFVAGACEQSQTEYRSHGQLLRPHKARLCFSHSRQRNRVCVARQSPSVTARRSLSPLSPSSLVARR